MNRLLLLLTALMLNYGSILGQEIPLFSQKLTNSFIYNPAVAGHTYGSITYSYKENYSNVSDAPKNNFLSFHTPILNHRVGVGASIYQEDVTFLRNMYASMAFAYHLPLSKITTLSFGVSSEYNSLKGGGLNFQSEDDPDYNAIRNGIGVWDFSFGTHFQNRFLKIGVASNRLSTAWLRDTSKQVLSNYYSSFVQGLIPLRSGEDLLEPYVAYRQLIENNQILDVGLFYTFNNKVIFGASMRNPGGESSIISGTLGYKLSKYLTVGYSREMILGNVSGFVGSANEFSIRFDFNENNYKERFSSDYKSSVAYRRKTMGGPARSGVRSPKQAQKKQKKLAPYSPNSRYQNIKKLSVKNSGTKKKISPSRKKKKSNSYRRKHRRRR